jgi:hypothetical protein
MAQAEVEALGSGMLRAARLDGRRVRGVYERDDLGDEDDIAGSRGRCYLGGRLIWINMRYRRDERKVGRFCRTRGWDRGSVRTPGGRRKLGKPTTKW